MPGNDVGVGQVASEFGVSPKLISDFCYRNQRLIEGSVRVVNGRRLIDREFVPILAGMMRRANLLPRIEVEREAAHA